MAKKDYQELKNFLENNYSKVDYLEVLKQFEENDTFEDLKDKLKEKWEATDGSLLSDERYQYLRSRVQQLIFEKKQKEGQQLIRRLIKPFNRIAALLLIPLFITSLYFFYQWRELAGNQESYVEIHCPPGTRSKFNLPDGTSGWLNSNSYLKYPALFLHNRHVDLIGEAYFDVKKDKHSPFTVSAEGVDVEVLGTHFNVMAYPDSEHIEISLEKGSVKVTREGTDLSEILKPDQRLVHDKNTNTASIISGDTGYFTSWKDGFLVFRNVPFSEVASRLSRWYNSEIIIQDDILKNIPYRATFKEEPLERILFLLSLSTPIDYTIVESKTNKDGIYEKQKVIISYRQ